MKKINPIIQWWVGPKLPIQHIYINSKDPIRGFYKAMIAHPIKRRVSKYYLMVLKKFGLRVVGITGSAGKTTTKDMIASIVEQSGKTVSTFKNIDPVFNIPASILKCTPRTKYLVLEMGVEYPGEMDYYMWLAKPDIGVITNIFPTHTEFFGDIEGVFKEKSKLAINLKKSSTMVLNGFDIRLKQLAKKVPKVVLFSGADPMSQNAEAAAKVAGLLSVSKQKIEEGLKKFKLPEHRMQIIKHKSGGVILDDSYNNNPEAAKSTLKVFWKMYLTKRKVVVFGDMLELGKLKVKYHKELGEFIGKLSPKYLICVGPASKITADVASKVMGKNRVFHFLTVGESEKEVQKNIKKDIAILVKGSRSIGLDKLVSDII